MKKICLWAYGGIWGGIKTKILETIQNTTSFLPQNLQPQISQNKNPKTNNTQVKTFLAQREEKAICFFLYSLSALLWTSGNVQCLQISHVTLNVFATPPELSWKKSLISKLEHQAEPKTYLRASVLSRDGGAGRVWDLSSNSVSWMTKTRRNLLTFPEFLLQQTNPENRKRRSLSLTLSPPFTQLCFLQRTYLPSLKHCVLFSYLSPSWM